MSEQYSTIKTMSPEFAKALVKMQGSLEGAKKGNANPAFRSKYADLGACWDACREALQENNMVLLQPTTHADSGFVGIRTVLIYGPTGESFNSFYKVPIKDPTNPQALGSAITYGRRYALCSLIGICPVDDDGNAAAQAKNPPKVKEKPQEDTKFLLTALKDAWKVAKTKDEMKTVFRTVKNSSLDELTKTTFLNEIVERIKGLPE